MDVNMPIILARVDDRLIHGQVTEGWGKKFPPSFVLVVSDHVVCSEFESDICLAALPDAMQGRVVGVDSSPSYINEMYENSVPSYVLFESPKDAYEAVVHGADITVLNVGGMHSTKGKRELADYIYVDDEDIYYLKALHEKGVKLDFRDLPDNGSLDVLSMI